MAAKGGYVYAIANDAMPGLVKLGATTRDTMERLHEARACTWAPPSFRLIAAARRTMRSAPSARSTRS
jgi:hypothetical protein